MAMVGTIQYYPLQLLPVTERDGVRSKIMDTCLLITLNAGANAILERVFFHPSEERDVVTSLIAKSITTPEVMTFTSENGLESFGLQLNGTVLPDLECDHGGNEYYHADRIYEAVKHLL